MAINDEKTLGFTAELYTSYMDSVKASLFCKSDLSILCNNIATCTSAWFWLFIFPHKYLTCCLRVVFFAFTDYVFASHTKASQNGECTESFTESKTSESTRGW